jgi:hypothetical protein
MRSTLAIGLAIISLITLSAVSADAKGSGEKLTVALPDASDFAFECDLTFKPDSGGAAALIVYAQSDARNRYELRVSRHKLMLTLVREGKSTPLIEGVKVAPSGMGRMGVSVRRDEGRTTIEVRGEPAASVYDNELASGAVAWGPSSGAVEMTNVSARRLMVPEYTARPDAVTAYTSGPALLGSTLTVAASDRLRVRLPAHVSRDSIEITDGGTHVPAYQIVDDPMARLGAGRGTVSELSQDLTLEWEAGKPAGEQPEQREVNIECLVSGVTWRPAYRLDVLDDEHAEITVDAVIVNSARDFHDTAVTVVSGSTAGSGGLASLGGAGGGGLSGLAVFLSSPKPDLYHPYAIPGAHDLPKDTTTSIELLRKTVPCAEHYQWDARLSQSVDVVYSIRNDTDLPWPKGTVRVYRDGTPIGEEVELEVADASPIQVERDPDVEKDDARGFKQEYHHTDTYEIVSPVGGRLELIVHKPLDGADETFTLEPTESESDRHRWQLELEPGEHIIIVHEYYDDTSSTKVLPRRG